MEIIKTEEYSHFIQEIKERIYKSQYAALRKVNKELISLYLGIGKEIAERQERFSWGNAIVETLSKDIQLEFPGIQGFSSRNLWYMRNLYLHYKDNTKLQPLVAEISWSHNIIILEKCNDDLQREFYIRMTIKYGWAKSILVHQIEGKSYNLFLANQTNFNRTVEAKHRHQAKLAVKDTYTFDFLELANEYVERELEQALINNIRGFLQEMGGDFTFIGNQYKVSVEGDDYYIDLLLYHRKLKSLVAIELKTTEFKPEYAGKMQYYLAVLDDKVKLPDENPSIGIIICKTKKRTVVEYALKVATKPMGIADYSLSEALPKEWKGLLPTPEEITETLSNINLNL